MGQQFDNPASVLTQDERQLVEKRMIFTIRCSFTFLTVMRAIENRLEAYRNATEELAANV